MLPTTDTFLLRERIHRGGMGLVWRARKDSRAGRKPVHLFEPELAALPALLKHIRHEARLAADRNATAVIDRVASHSVLVMEHAEGLSLACLLRTRGRFPLDRALDVVGQVLGALTVLHDTGMVHADLQPSSVVVDATEDGDLVSLVDFGGIDDAAGAGATEYMAPEVIMGGEPTVAADIYAVGVILYELLSGEPPYRGKTAIEVMTRQLHHPPAPLALCRPDVAIPAAVERLCLQAMARSPAARFPNARSFAAALRVALAPATPPSPAHGHDHVERMRAALADAIDHGTGQAIVHRTIDLALLLDREGHHPEAIAALARSIELVMWDADDDLSRQLHLAIGRLDRRARMVH